MSKPAPKRCSLDGCPRPHRARGYCLTHWSRWKATGDPGPAEIKTLAGRRRYTDDEMAILADLSIPAVVAAEALGVTRRTVYVIRKEIDLEAFRASEWLRSEVDFILESFKTMTIEQMAAFLGRTYNEVHTEYGRLRRNGEVPPRPVNSYNPSNVANRSLLAKTCLKCGLLLDARWFSRDRRTAIYQPSCRRCAGGRLGRLPEDQRQERVQANGRLAAKLQSLTLEQAENRGKEWTESDLKVLADPNKTSFQKALELKRTYFSINNAAHSRGLTSKPDWEGMESAEWALFWEFDVQLEEAS